MKIELLRKILTRINLIYVFLLLLIFSITELQAFSFYPNRDTIHYSDTLFPRSHRIPGKSFLGFTSASFGLIKPFSEYNSQKISHLGGSIGAYINQRRGQRLDVFSGILLSFRNGTIKNYRNSYYSALSPNGIITREYLDASYKLFTIEVPLVFRFNVSGDYTCNVDFAPSFIYNKLNASGKYMEKQPTGNPPLEGYSRNFIPNNQYRIWQVGLNFGLNWYFKWKNHGYDLSIWTHTGFPDLFKEEVSNKWGEIIGVEPNTSASFFSARINRWF